MEPPRYSAEVKERAVRAVAAGESVAIVAKRFGVATEASMYTWLSSVGLTPPYGPGFVKQLPPRKLFEDLPPRPPGAPAGPRKSYNAEFKRNAVRALALAVAEGEVGPLNAVSRELEIAKSMLRDWAYKAGYMAYGGGLDWDKLRRDGATGPGSPAEAEEPRASLPSMNTRPNGVPVLVIQTSAGRQEITEDMLRRLWEDREHLLHENRELKRQREVFMQATTIFGQERTS